MGSPGGFLELAETIQDGARREALEETGLVVELNQLTGTY
ncbi:NUDIX domain-containing protein [Kribbella antibiotica]